VGAFGAASDTPSLGLDYDVARAPGSHDPYPRVASAMGGSASGSAAIMTPLNHDSLQRLSKRMNDRSLGPGAMAKYQKQIENAQSNPVGRFLDRALGPLSPSRHGHDGFQATKTGVTLASVRDIVTSTPELGPLYGALIGSTGRKGLGNLLRFGDLHDPTVQASEGPVFLPRSVGANGERSGVWNLLEDVERESPDKLHIKGGSTVNRVLFEKNKEGEFVRDQHGNLRVIGVEYLDGPHGLAASPEHNPNQPGTKRVVHSDNVVLAANPVETVKILMRSGVGPKEALRQAGIETAVDRPGVGQVAGDRLESTIRIQFDHKLPVLAKLRTAETKLREVSAEAEAHPGDPAVEAKFKQVLGQYKGVLEATLPFAIQWKSRPELDKPDVLVIPTPGDFDNFNDHKDGVAQHLTGNENMASVLFLKIESKSQGTVGPDGRMSVNYAPLDKEAMADALVRFNKEIAPKLGGGARIVHGNVKTKAEALAFLDDHHNFFGHHWRGGAVMGPQSDPNAVVDANQRVYGTSNLYIAGTPTWDSSMGPFPIMPIEAFSARLADRIAE
jgi:hypothetical protein